MTQHESNKGTVMEDVETADLLYGVPAISRHLKMTAPAVRHLVREGHIPTFKIGGKVCARPSKLASWLVEQENAAEAARVARKSAAKAKR